MITLFGPPGIGKTELALVASAPCGPAQLADDQPMTGGALVRRLGKRPAQLSQPRARLIEKGTIVAEGYALSFVVPGMAAYVLRALDAARPNEIDEPGPPPALLAIRPTMKPVTARRRRSNPPR